MPFRPEAGAPGEIAYQIVSAIFTSFQVSADAKNREIVLKSLCITKFHKQQQSTLEKKI
jgi:hypothetical protein